MKRAVPVLAALVAFVAFQTHMEPCLAASSQIELTDPIDETLSTFGDAVAFAGPGMVLVGAPSDPVGPNVRQGAVHVYKKTPGGAWARTQILTASDGATWDFFGYSVAVSGNTAVIGAYIYGGTTTRDVGKAYIFTNSGGTWTQTAILQASDAQPCRQFGWSVAIDGTTALIGAPQSFSICGSTYYGPGAVYVFQPNGSGVWTQTQKLVGSNTQNFDAFGYSVALSGSTAFIGTPRHNSLILSGSAFVFTASGGTWSQADEVFASNPALQDEFGNAVAMSGSTAIVGAPAKTWSTHVLQGLAYVFKPTAGVWTQTQLLAASNGAAHDLFGSAIALQNGTAVIGAFERTIAGRQNQGAAYVFTETSNVFNQSGFLTANNGAAHDLFGFSVAVSNPLQGGTGNGRVYLIGAPGVYDATKPFSGAAYILGE